MHAAQALRAASEGKLGELRAHAIQATLAGPSSLLRRIAGYAPSEPSQGSLIQTWRRRPGSR